MVFFNEPYFVGNETKYISDAVQSGHISGNGQFTKRCQSFFENRYGFKKTLLTTSCTDALEMCALLLDIQPGDEVIIPSYTFVSTALAFIRQGAVVKFVDSRIDHPGMDEDQIERLITSKTKAIVPVHYAGVACDMDKIMALAEKYGLFVVEDAAQAIDNYYTNAIGEKRPLGSIGHLATFSFHETKNIQCGEGGLLVINDDRFIHRAEIIWEKGTNRAAFFRGAINKYGWVDTGSSFLPSEIIAAFLWAQLETLESIQRKRKNLWDAYYDGLVHWGAENNVQLPMSPAYTQPNGHMFYLVFPHVELRTSFIQYLRKRKVEAVFHYQSLHKSEYYINKHDGRNLSQSDYYTDGLVRLPLHMGIDEVTAKLIIDTINEFSYDFAPN